jgi:hypothetical protein
VAVAAEQRLGAGQLLGVPVLVQVRLGHRAERLVGGESGAELEQRRPRAGRHQHPARLREVRREPVQLLALERRLAHQGHVAQRQVAQAAMDQLGGAARGAGGEVAASTSATRSPRSAASRAMPAPVMPPPITSRSKRSRGEGRAGEAAQESGELARGRECRVSFGDESADLAGGGFGERADRRGRQRNRFGRFAGAAEVTMAAIVLRQGFTEVGEQAAGDAAGLAGEVDDLRQPAGVARFAQGKQLALPQTDARRISPGRVVAEAKAVAQAGRLLGDGSGFLQPGKCPDDTIARLAELLRGRLDVEREGGCRSGD